MYIKYLSVKFVYIKLYLYSGITFPVETLMNTGVFGSLKSHLKLEQLLYVQGMY